jgi:hypothetical protein
MIYLLAGLVIAWVALQAIRMAARAKPAEVVALVRRGGAALMFAVAVFLLMKGQFEVAAFAAGLGGYLSFRDLGTSRGRRPSPAGISRVRSAMIEMEFESRSGSMRGTVLAGPDEGAALDQLSRGRCDSLYRLCLSVDPDGARLLEPYFDRRFPGWRAARHDERDAGAGGPAASRASGMSENEAYQVLGLPQGASRDEVVRSHRTLIKRLHPDQGGTTDLAARVNEAKDVLMRRSH